MRFFSTQRVRRSAIVGTALAVLCLGPSAPVAAQQEPCPYPNRLGVADGATVGELQLWRGFDIFCREPSRIEITRDGRPVPQQGNWFYGAVAPGAGQRTLRFDNKPIPNGRYEVTLGYDAAGGFPAEIVKVRFTHRDFIAGVIPYFDHSGPIDIAIGDIDGDGRAEIVTGAGPSGGPHVMVFKVGGEPANLNEANNIERLMSSFMAYDPAFSGGVNVAVGDVNGDGRGEIITGPGPGGGPHVRVFGIGADGTATAVDGFMAYTPGFRGGVDVAAGNLAGSRADEVIVGAGPGGGPHVRVVRRAPGGFAAGGGDVASFMAYGEAFRGGINVSAYVQEPTTPVANWVLTGARAGGGPHVRVFVINADGDRVVRSNTSFFAYGPGFTGGVDVAGAPIFQSSYPNRGGPQAMLSGAGPGGGPHARVWNIAQGYEIGGWFFTQDPNSTRGLRVATGDVTGDGRADLAVAGFGNGQSSVEIRPY